MVDYKLAVNIERDILNHHSSKYFNFTLKNPLKQKIAELYFIKYIKPIKFLIDNKKYDEAVNLYVIMTNSLRNLYGLNNYSITIEEINNADIEKSGHGKYIQKKITL